MSEVEFFYFLTHPFCILYMAILTYNYFVFVLFLSLKEKK